MRDQEYERLLSLLKEADHIAASPRGMWRRGFGDIELKCLVWLMTTVRGMREKVTTAMLPNIWRAEWHCPYDDCGVSVHSHNRQSNEWVSGPAVEV